MRAAFIASEYNPFHNGHKYHIERTKENGADAVICVMSGNFVQRGDIAIAEKHIRAKAALMGGADLVLELPLKYAVSTASYFAQGFVVTAAALGLDGFISCGATADKKTLELICDTCFSSEAENFAREQLSIGINYPKAKTIFLRDRLGGEYSDIISEPNNILAIEYINALRRFAPSFGFDCIDRVGVRHDSFASDGIFTSASNLRNMIYCSDCIEMAFNEISSFMPSEVLDLFISEAAGGHFPASVETFNNIAVSRLLSLESNFFEKLNNVNGGLNNRLIKSIRSGSSLNEIADSSKSKIFTHSRIRQILINAVLGITKDDINHGISYIRVLGFNDRGRELLNSVRNSADLPVISNLSELDLSVPQTRRDAELDYLSGKLFGLCLEKRISGNPEYYIPPVYLR